MTQNPVTAWSYSAYSLYNQCPFKYKLVKIDKLKEPQSPHLERGNRIHKEGELFLVGKTDEVPESYANFADLLVDLKGMDPYCEQEWAFDRSWKRTSWHYTNKKCWLRVKTDVCAVDGDDGLIIDFKTGKKYDENVDQVELFGLAAMYVHPQVKNWDIRLWYLDSGDEVQFERNRSTKERIRHEWTERIGPMFADTTFAPRPNKFCGWCHFRKSNGGPCSHG